MRQNLVDVDRTIRLLIGGLLAIPIIGRDLRGNIAVILGLIAVYLLSTAIAGWDPFYMVLRISSKPQPPHD